MAHRKLNLRLVSKAIDPPTGDLPLPAANNRDDIAIKLAMRLEDSSDWLCYVIDSACDRDLEHVISELERALIAFRSVLARRQLGNLH